jgi:surfactin family lipopeptide synthetase A
MKQRSEAGSDLTAEQRRMFEELMREEGIEVEQRQRIEPVERRGEGETWPLSFAQQRLWFLYQLDPGTASYNIPMALRLRGPLHFNALEAALSHLTFRHHSLRTRFVHSDGLPAQIIDAHLPRTLPLFDLSHVPATEREGAAMQLATDDANRPFELSVGPLFRFSLLRLSTDEYIILLCLHHIISDGWSVSILLRELSLLYDAFSEGRPAPLAELSIQYADYALWQREYLRGETLAAELSYWKEQLAGAAPLLDLPTDHTRPPVQSYRGASLRLRVKPELTLRLQSMSRAQGVTLFMSLLAVFRFLLWRYSGQEDVSIGTPMAGRNRAELESIVGFFINTLTLRTEVRGEESFRSLLSREREVCLGGYAHQDLPFEKLVEELQPERSLSHTPLFQVMFSLMNVPPGKIRLRGMEARALKVEHEATKFDLALSLAETNGELAGEMQYKRELYEATSIERMSAHYLRLLDAVLENPERPLWQMPLLSRDEERQLIFDWNRTSPDYPREGGLHQLFEAQAERTPQAIAVWGRDEHISYQDLNSRANQLAHYLQSLGAGAEDLVAVCLERSVSMVVALLAVLKAGAAYVPLDASYPVERLQYMLDDARVKLLLTQQSLLGALPQQHSDPARQHSGLVLLDADQQSIALHRPQNPTARTMPQHLAYVIYTSGSTGRPKGVAIEHHSPVALLQWSRNFFTQAELSGVLASTSICFDLSVFELFAPLSRGGKVILAENVLSLANLKSAEQVSLINTVPSAMTELLRMGKVPSSVRTVNLAGEVLTATLVQHLYQKRTIERVVNLYGPTEDTTYSTCANVERTGTGAPPIGRPVTETEVYILDQYLQPVPVGAAGELYIAGQGLARGYLNRPEQTALRFIPHPFSQRAGARLYRTGDKARYMADGNIQFMGRMDRQVKLRGFRIELGEIAAVLREHQMVEEAVVVCDEEQSGEKRLVAYVVAKESVDIDFGELRRHVQEKLPGFMIPALYSQLDALPLTVNGKIDYRALPPPDKSRPSMGDRHLAPRNDLEEALAGIWADLLRVNAVGVEDNFFELGGHSLLAMQIIYRVKERLRVELPLRALFESPTVAALAVVVGQHQTASVNDNSNTLPLTARKPDAEMFADVESLSEDKLDDLLISLLSEEEPAP